MAKCSCTFRYLCWSVEFSNNLYMTMFSYLSIDLTENSVEVCKQRYNERKNHSSYRADFYTLDCTKVSLQFDFISYIWLCITYQELIQEKLGSSKPCFDLVSSQFVLHYSFDKIESADRFLRNAAELLRVGGYFIGTTVNSSQLVYVFSFPYNK